jgi:hypothetical protein
MSKDLPIVYVNRGVANRFHDRIEVNEALKNYKKHPHLHDFIVEHEKRHTDKVWSIKDLWNELSFANYRYGLAVLDFIAETPSARNDLLPIQTIDGKKVIDFNLLLIYCSATILGIFLVFRLILF